MKTVLSLLFVLAAVSAHAQLALNFHFVGMTPHVGQTGHIRIIDDATSKEVVRVRETILSADYTVWLFCLQGAHSYTVDFYADMNMNGVYDPPPMDHAWRRTVVTTDTDAELTFVHNTQFTDVTYPNEPPTTTNIVNSLWSGTWHNTTFATTGPGSATQTLNGTTSSFSGSITLVGAFGSPIPVTISGAGPWDQDADSAVMIVDAPLTGTIAYVRGKVTGMVTYTDFGVNMELNGNYGQDQLMFTYAMSGGFTAEGWMLLNRDQTTDVAEQQHATASSYPNPAQSLVTITWDPVKGAAKQVLGSSVLGSNVALPIQTTEHGKAIIDVSDLSDGMYVLRVQTDIGSVITRLVK